MPDSDVTDGSSIFKALVENAAPAVRLRPAESGKSRIGGRPGLREDVPWPQWGGKPQAFLAQIDLQEVRQAGGPDWPPDHGTLFFFYDSEQSTWGFKPDDRGSWAVIHDPLGAPGSLSGRMPGVSDGLEYPAQTVAMVARPTLPTPERLQLPWFDLSDQELDELSAAEDAFDPDYPLHQIGGWPRPVQNDTMELECQLVSNGIDCGGPEGYRSQAARDLASGASEWRLLLQLDSDETSDMMWGDFGRLYFWIRESDARASRFENVWMILQCS